MSYLYLASPYTHQDPKVRVKRFHKVMDFTAYLANKRQWVFSPILHSHQMTIAHNLPYTFEFWDPWNQAMIRPSSGVIVFQIDGSTESHGMKAEMEFAESLGLPLIYSRGTWPSYDHSI